MQEIISFTDEQIDLLFAFASSKGVEDVDLQDEVVKELSAKISNEMKEQPSLNFDQALENVYARFPITGFAVFLNGKQKEIKKYCIKQYNKSLLRFFISKNILLVVLIFAVCFTTTTFLVGKWGFWVFFVLIFLLQLYIIFKSRRKLVAPSNELKKLFFYRTFIMNFNAFMDDDRDFPSFQSIFMWSWLVFFPLNMDLTINVLFRVLAAVFSALLLVFAYHTYVEMPKLINEEIKNRFSHQIRLNETTSQDSV